MYPAIMPISYTFAMPNAMDRAAAAGAAAIESSSPAPPNHGVSQAAIRH